VIYGILILNHHMPEPNPQQIHPEAGSIQWDYWLLLGFFWFAIVGGGLSLIFSVVSAGVILFYKVLQNT
jgi:hypothetical protein